VGGGPAGPDTVEREQPGRMTALHPPYGLLPWHTFPMHFRPTTSGFGSSRRDPSGVDRRRSGPSWRRRRGTPGPGHAVEPFVRSIVLITAVALILGLTPAVSSAAVSIEDYGEVSAPGSVDGYRGAGLRVVVPRGAHWGLGTFEPVPSGRASEAWFRYMIVLDVWEPSQSGKLPGFASLRSSSGRGCVPPSASRSGWSARMMYRPAGEAGAPEGSSRIGYYVYHLDQPKDCGEILEWNDAGMLQPGKWHCIEGHIRLNSPGSRDGALTGWVDGTEAFSQGGFRFRDRPGVGIDDLWMNVFSGGRSPSPERLGLRLDEVAISTHGRIGCPDQFNDDESNPNEAAINLLASLGAFPACGPFLGCPDEPLRRGELATMLVAAAGLPDGPNAFTDDDGHPHEAAIDAMAAANLTSGCGPGLYCPDDPVSRGDASMMIARAFGLPFVDGVDFADVVDPGQAESAAALVAAGAATGCAPGLFCSDAPLTRSHAAAMLAAVVSQDRADAAVYGRAVRPSLEEVVDRQRPAWRPVA
jgi:hypothetical protein